MTLPKFRVRHLCPVRVLAPFGCMLVAAGCASTPAASPADRTPTTLRSPGSSGVPAIIDGRALDWGTLQTLLSEAAGGVVLEEVALDQAVEVELQRQGLVLSEDDLSAERERLRAGLAAAGAGADAADRVRAARGLGPERYRRLVRRSAGLRALVAGDVRVEPSEVRLAHEIRTGPREVVRVIRTATEREAAALRSRIANSTEPTTLAFAHAAVEASIDSSAARGGLLEPISLADPVWPASVRSAIRPLSPGQLSPVLALDDGHGFVLLERRLPGSGVALSPDLEQRYREELRLRKERIEMESLARRLIGRAGVTALDPSLAWSWERRR